MTGCSFAVDVEPPLNGIFFPPPPNSWRERVGLHVSHSLKAGKNRSPPLLPPLFFISSPPPLLALHLAFIYSILIHHLSSSVNFTQVYPFLQLHLEFHQLKSCLISPKASTSTIPEFENRFILVRDKYIHESYKSSVS